MRKKELRSLCLEQQEELRQLRAEKEKLQAQLAEKQLLNSYLQMDLMDWSHCYEQLAQKPAIEIIMLDLKQLGLWSASLPDQKEKQELLQWLISQRQEQLNLLRDSLADRQLPQSEKERLFGLFQQASLCALCQQLETERFWTKFPALGTKKPKLALAKNKG